jgi:hypothetical protein
VTKEGATRFGARTTANANILPIVELQGPLRAATWDRHGLVAVVGNALVRWVRETNVLERIAVDAGLNAATGVCSIDGTRALVTLRSATLLFTGQAPTVIAAIGGMCRVASGDLYLFDPRLRRVWKLTNIAEVGGQPRDLAYARRLLQLSVTQGVTPTRTPEFAEAVRLVGCRKATEIAFELQK